MEEGAVIRPGFSPDLDGLRDAERDAQQAIMKLEQQERERTGIRSLKVGFNKVFGLLHRGEQHPPPAHPL